MSSGTEDDSEGQSWVDWFCRLKGHEFFCEVSFMPREAGRVPAAGGFGFIAARAASLMHLFNTSPFFFRLTERTLKMASTSTGSRILCPITKPA